MTVTTGMVGHGFYDRNSAPQWAAIEAVLPWLEEAIAGMRLAEVLPTIGVADFGCSEGRNSIQVMQRLVPAFRARTARPIQTLHSDLATNDYRALLRDLWSDGRSVFGERTLSAVVGGSMFDQPLPPGSIHVAMTYNAIGFLSRRPVDRLPGYILPNGPSALRGAGTVSAEDRRVFAAQAPADLESFMRAPMPPPLPRPTPISSAPSPSPSCARPSPRSATTSRTTGSCAPSAWSATTPSATSSTTSASPPS